MQQSMMSQVDMDHQHHNQQENHGYGQEGWVEMSGYSSHHQSPIHEYNGFGYMPSASQNVPVEPSFHRMALPSHHHPAHQQLLPLIMPSHPTWPSMLTNPSNYQPPPVALPPAQSLKTTKLPAIHTTAPTARKTLSDSDRKQICIFNLENPSVKQTEIGAMFGVERSTISKVLRQKEKYLFPEDRSLSPVKRAKGKFPDIERALANWVRNSQKQGMPLTDAAIREKARFFAQSVGNTESHLKANSTSWLEKFKQKNGIGGGKMTRRASETNISDSGSLHPDSNGASAPETPNGISPVSPTTLPSPSPLSAVSRSEDSIKETLEGYMGFNSDNSYRPANGFPESAQSSFSADPTSPTTPYNFSPDTYMSSSSSRAPHGGNAEFQRPRSQTFPMLNLDPLGPSYISPPTPSESLIPTGKYTTQPSLTSGASALDSNNSPTSNDALPPLTLDSSVSSPHLRHSSSKGSMASMAPPMSSNASATSSPISPTQDDARRALYTLLCFFNTAPNGLVDQNDYMTVLKLTEKLRLRQGSVGSLQGLQGGLQRIPEDGNEGGMKMEQGMSV